MTNIVDLTRSSPPDVQASNWKSWPTALEEAIKNAQPDRLRRTLSVLCRNLPDAAKSAAFLLLVSDDMAKVKPKRQTNAGVDGQRMGNDNNKKILTESLNEDPSEVETQDDDEDDDEDEDGSQDDDEDDDGEEDQNEEAEEQKVANDDNNDRKKDKENEGKEEGKKHAGVSTKQDVPGIESSHSATAILNGKKRLRSKYAVCSNCKEEFDVTQNGKKACRWHDGMNLCTRGWVFFFSKRKPRLRASRDSRGRYGGRFLG